MTRELPHHGRWFEELAVGDVIAHALTRTVTETDNLLITTLTLNPARLHLDAEYSAETEFGQPLVNSMFTLALLVGMSVLETTHGTTIANLGFEEVTFPAPVFCGDTIHAETEVVAARASGSRPDAGIVTFEHRAFNQHDVLVCRARAERVDAPASGVSEAVAAPSRAPLWTPGPARAAATRLAAFADGRDYAALHAWSVEDPGAFWAAAWEFTGVIGDRGERVIETADPFWKTRFFPDARLNVAETLLRDPSDEPALLFAREDGARRTVTRAELHDTVSRVQQALRAAGVQPGDRVVAWLPNVPEVYALMLGAASLGAVFSSTSPDFGVDGVVDRFGQIEPTVLVAADGYHYGGKWFDCGDRLAEIRARLPTLQTVVTDWDSWLAPYSARAVEFARLPFDHPWYVLYSSGTTGAPKCIVHRAGGVLLKHLAEHQLQCDIRSGDRVFYFTTTGWMMWNWLASVLGSGATAVVYDGSPTHPSPTTLFDLTDEVGITLFGTSARFVDALHKAGARPRDTHSLASLRTITSTGSPLSADGFRYVYDGIKDDVHLASISGGTDLCGCLVAGVPTQSVYAGEIQAPGLGMGIEVYDDGGRVLGPGEQGELVCTTPFPSMPLGFWNDPGDVRCARTYFERFPGTWHQGDFASWTEHGGVVISGRSDATLNPGGVRIGTAEVSAQVDKVDGVIESLVIGQEWDGDTRVVCFVVLTDGASLTDELMQEIRRRVRTGASPRHVPAKIIAVPDLPRTRSNKLSELAVRDVVHGRAVANTEALANPGALDAFRDLPELQS